jgi:pimeloyl-ACP methyl ester carboxylesterase
MDEYVEWLVRELRGLRGPVDVVGHDWGALLVVRAVTAYPVAVRSWAADVAGILHPDYVWHNAARLWQTAGADEEWVKATLDADLAEHGPAGQLVAAGVPAAEAGLMGAEFTATMAQCVLDLYRSATPNPHTHWAAGLSTPTAAPGLVIQPSLDPFDDQAASDRVAARLGARTRRLDGLGHWWMLEDPGTSAVLAQFWASLDE